MLFENVVQRVGLHHIYTSMKHSTVETNKMNRLKDKIIGLYANLAELIELHTIDSHNQEKKDRNIH